MPKPNFGQQVKALAKINGLDIFPEIKLYKPRKPRAKETQPRRQEEAQFRIDVVKYFKKKGIQYRRVENSIWGTHGRDLPDFWVFYLPTRFAGFVELKSPEGVLNFGQQTFKADCQVCGIHHIVARTLGDLKPITEPITGG